MVRFDARELRPYAEPVSANSLKAGSVYFSVTFVDEAMLIPCMEPFVFIGRDLEPGDSGQVYFQDIDSYRSGIRYSTLTDDDHVKITKGSEDGLRHVFEYEQALEVLMLCSLRRRRAPDIG